ncbi:MAG TPA: hypothetical protein VGH28_19355 [Polyangiaceae bacterium]
MSDLPETARRALERAREKKLSYAVRLLRAPDGRTLVVLGEAHMKLAEAAKIGHDVVAAFELRGVETFQRKRVFLGRALGVLIQAPRTLLRLVTFGAVKGSTITDAKQLPSGYTVELERTKHIPFGLHVTSLYMTIYFTFAFLGLLLPLIGPIAPPLAALIVTVLFALQVHMVLLVPAIVLRRYSWSWMIHPLIGILTLRDVLMSEGTVTMLADHRKEKFAVVVMGRAHLPGFSRLLIERHGFTEA